MVFRVPVNEPVPAGSTVYWGKWTRPSLNQNGVQFPKEMRSLCHRTLHVSSERIRLGITTSVYIYCTVFFSAYIGVTTIILGANIFRNKL